jgi:hypothetical protein
MNEYDPTSSEAMWEKHKDVVLAYQKALKKKKKKKVISAAAANSDLGIVSYDFK